MYSRVGDPVSPDGTPSPDLLGEVRPVLGEAMQFITDEFRNPDWAMPVTRQVQRWGKHITAQLKWPDNMKRVFAGFVSVSAGLVAQEGGAGNETEFIDGLLHTHLGETAENAELAFIPEKILETAEAIRRLSGLSEAVIGSLRDTVTEDEEQFGLMKLLAFHTPFSKSGPGSQEAQTLQILDTFASLGDEKAGMKTAVDSALGAGTLDSLIGEEILHDAVGENGMLDSRARREMRLLIGLGGHLLRESAESSVIARLVEPASLPLWPDAHKQLFDTRKSQYAQDMRDNYRRHAELLATYRCIHPKSTVEEVSRSADNLILELAKLRSTDTDLHMSQRLGARATLVRMEKVKTRPEPSAEVASAAEPAPQERPEEVGTPQEPLRKLAYIKPDGSEAPEGSAECNDFFDDYLAKHRGQTGLAEDLERIKNYLRNEDFSAGIPRGIHTFGASKQKLKRGTRPLPKVYQLTPAEAVGLPTSSELGMKLRVLFVLNNDTVGLLGIGEKSRMRALQRKIGIPGRARTK
jgi:hypothetical protein